MFKKWSYVRLQRNVKELCQMKYEQYSKYLQTCKYL